MSINKRTRAILLAAAGVLLVLIIGGVWLMNRSGDKLLSGELSGAALQMETPYALKPRFVGSEAVTLAIGKTGPPGGYWVFLWQWETEYAKLADRGWAFEPTRNDPNAYNIYNSYRSCDPVTRVCKYVTGNQLAVKDDSRAEGADVITWSARGGDNHAWYLVDAGNMDGIQWYQIKSKSSGLCLAIRNSATETATYDGAALIQVSCDWPTDYQFWQFIPIY